MLYVTLLHNFFIFKHSISSSTMKYFEQVVILFIPILFFLLILEKLYGYFRFGDAIRGKDIITGLSSGMTSILKDIFGLTVFVISYEWLYEHIRLVEIETGIWTYIIALVIIDFAGYWWHRFMHKMNILWNEHLIHHSSEEFDLACALRQPISNIVTWIPIFIFPAALLGISPVVISILTPIHVFAQYWYHTKYIGKLGFLESIIVTPSHHRVHHAQNPEYLDKNLGLIFIFWDKMFGTFQEELEDVPPVYGVTRPVSTWNPIKINFTHFFLLLKDAFRAPKWSDKFKIWFMPTGWRPEGFDEKYPISTIKDVYTFKKYSTQLRLSTFTYIWIEFISAFFFFILFIIGISGFYFEGAVAYGLMIAFCIFGYSELMDRKRGFIIWIWMKDIIALYMLYQTKHWDHIMEIIPAFQQISSCFFVLSAIWSIIILFSEFNSKNTPVTSPT